MSLLNGSILNSSSNGTPILNSLVNNPLLIIIGLILIISYISKQIGEKTQEVSKLWVMPVVMLYLSYISLEQGFFATLYGPLLMLIGLVIGGIIGIIRCKHIDIRLGTEEGTIIVKGSLVSFAIWASAFAIKIFIGYIGYALNINMTSMQSITSALMMISLGNMFVYSGYLYLKYSEMINKRTINLGSEQ